MNRLTKDEYFMDIARTVAKRSTCLDKQVGCVLVNSKGIILSTGYNGAPSGMAHCCDNGICLAQAEGNKLICPAAHAEQNAMLYADANDIFACYCTLEPCVTCTRMLMNTVCTKVIFGQVTNPKHSGKQLWSKVNDTATWQYRPCF